MNAMRVLSASEMQLCDHVTSEHFGISSLQLMRHASGAVAALVREQFAHARRIVVLCGRGNNGGDGAMAARHLAWKGHDVTVLLLGSPDSLKGDAAIAWKELHETHPCRIAVIQSAEDLRNETLGLKPDLILDAIVGTGFQPPLKGLALDALEWVESVHVPVLAVDLPSGWPADETHGSIDSPVFPADAVITFTSPKPAHVFCDLTRRWDQPVIVAPIGSPDEAIVSELGITWAGSSQSLLHAPRNADSNKGRFGHVLVIGGSFGSAGGKAGAPAMTAMAALRVGAGLVTAAVPVPALPIVAGFAPELMTWPLKANAEGQASPDNLAPDRIAALTKGMSVLAIGPALGQGVDTARFCIGVLEATTMPAVIDADGLNILSQDLTALGKLARNGRTVVLTPHPGEMARLTGMSTKEVQANRLDVARKFALHHEVTLVLKGAHTIIAHPDGRVAVNTTGNPGMAKGGSGDLLTGIIAGLLAQFPDDPAHAVEAAVHLHGLAADLAVRNRDEHTLLATDTLAYFSRAFRFHSQRKNGYVWLQGLPPEMKPAPRSCEAVQ